MPAYDCSSCRKTFDGPDDLPGNQVACPHCLAVIFIPELVNGYKEGLNEVQRGDSSPPKRKRSRAYYDKPMDDQGPSALLAVRRAIWILLGCLQALLGLGFLVTLKDLPNDVAICAASALCLTVSVLSYIGCRSIDEALKAYTR